MVISIDQEYRPRADDLLLRELNDRAWIAAGSAQNDTRIEELKEKLRVHINSLFPSDDMAVLGRYGATRLRYYVHVKIVGSTGDEWDAEQVVLLNPPLMVPKHFRTLQCGGVLQSTLEHRGLGLGRRLALERNEQWANFCAEQDRHERERVPGSLETFFLQGPAFYREYRRGSNQIFAWPRSFKAEHGRHPTWVEIAAEHPVVGPVIVNHFGA